MTNEFRLKNTRAAKINLERVAWARERWAAGEATQRALADAVGISTQQMGRILRGESWRDAPRPKTIEDATASQARVIAMLRAQQPELLPEGALALSKMEKHDAERAKQALVVEGFPEPADGPPPMNESPSVLEKMQAHVRAEKEKLAEKQARENSIAEFIETPPKE